MTDHLDQYLAQRDAEREARIKAGQEAFAASKVWLRPGRNGEWVQDNLNFGREPGRNWRLVTVREARAMGVYI